MTNRGAPSAVWQFFSCLNKTKQKEKKKILLCFMVVLFWAVFSLCAWFRQTFSDGEPSEPGIACYSRLKFLAGRLLRTDSLALWICVYRDKVKMFWVFWFFLDFLGFFWEVVFYILFLFLVAPYVKMITDLFKNNNDNILITNNY